MSIRPSLEGQHEFSEMRAVEEIRVVEVDSDNADASNYVFIPVEDETIVSHIDTIVTEALAGGTPDCIITDGEDSPVTFLNMSAFTLGTFSQGTTGKYFSSAGKIRVAFAADHSAGKVKLLIHQVRLQPINVRTSGWRLPAL